MITPTKKLPALRQVRAIIGRTARYKKKLTAVICKAAFRAKEISKPGNPTIISAMIVNRLHISPKIIDNTPHTINFPVNSFLKEIGTVRIFFNVSSVCSREIIYPAIRLIHIGKIMDILFLMTCSVR